MYRSIHCIYNIIIVNAYVPKQVDIGLDTPVKIINQNGRSNAVPCAVRTVSVQNDNHGF